MANHVGTSIQAPHIDKPGDIHMANLRLDYAFTSGTLFLEEGKVFFTVDTMLDAKYAYTLAKDSASQRAFCYMPGTAIMVGMELKF